MIVRFENWVNWFRQMWPGDAQRSQVLMGYRAIGQQFPKALADMALRNGVFSGALDAHTDIELAIAEGRRRAVLELFKLCNMNVNDLYAQTLDNGSNERKKP